jgi:hypothetical protein
MVGPDLLHHAITPLALLLCRRSWRFASDVKKFDNTGEETDDLISIGTVGFRN